MKTLNFNFKSILKPAWLVMVAFLAFGLIACEDDDDNGGGGDDDIVLDGFYVSGEATGMDGISEKMKMQQGRVEGEDFASVEREGMYETFLYLNSGDFRFTEVEGDQNSYYGASGDEETVTPDSESEYVTGTYETANDEESVSFSVEEDGMYHLILDTQTNSYFIVNIDHFAVIGDATSERDWETEFPMETAVEAQDSSIYEIKDLTLRSGDVGGFKFRYNDGFKISVNEELVLFTNIGITEGELQMGGGNFTVDEDGKYTVKFKYEDGNFTKPTFNKTGDVEPLPEYPDSLYMIGSAFGDNGWDWSETNKPMVPTHSHENLFWKITYLEADSSFKFAPKKEWAGDFGGDGSGVTDGEIPKGEENITVPGESGYYMVVVDLEQEMIAVSDTPMVYLLGETTLEGDTAVWEPHEDFRFDVDNTNEVITFTNQLYLGDVRLAARHSWFNDLGVEWWQAEFNIIDGNLEFRGRGDDQTGIPTIESKGTYTIDLNFKNGTGSVVQQ